MSWLTDIVELHSEYESPSLFWKWAALASISATVKDNIWIDKFLYKTYPNIYVMLLADSGLKKGAPISMAKQLVRAVNGTKIISGRSSIQGILKKLGTAESKPGGIIQKNSTAFICSSELSSSIVEDKAANKILTDLYDRNYNAGEWESLLKMEAYPLKDTTITMLTGTNEAQNESLFERADIQGGYIARTFIVYEKERQTLNSLMYAPKNIPNYEELSKYLKELAKLRGGFIMSDEVRGFFDNWYKDFQRNIITQKMNDLTGTMNRFDDSVLKTAMLISLGHSPKLEITIDAVSEAILECTKLIGGARKSTIGAGKSIWTQEKALVIEELIDRSGHAITRQQLNNKYWMRANSNEWDEIMKSLEVAGIITIQSLGNNIIYRMPDERVQEWKDHLRGK